MINKNIRLAGIAYESLVNGPGLRRVFFSQGCRHNCKGCFNMSTHCFDGGEIMDMDNLIQNVKENPMIKGITFSGGDPFEQAKEFAYMGEKFKELSLNIWCYTGYTFEHILKNMNEKEDWRSLLEQVDVLVDGKFEESKKADNLKYRGSSNQRVIDVKKSIGTGDVVIVDV